jgi:hypothetical protein
MATKKTAPKFEDEEQSRRFIDTARELEASGDIDVTEGEVAFERAFKKMVPTQRPK